jgi:hypothetical protein
VAEAKASSTDLKNYLALFARGKASDLRAQLERQSEEIHSAQGRLITGLRKLAQAERAEQHSPKQNVAELEREYRELLKHPDIERIVFRSNQVTVYTKLITVTCDDHYHKIGKFRIELSLTSAIPLLIHNVTNPRGSYDHPWVRAGLARSADFTRRVVSMITKGDISRAIRQCMEYLHTGPNSWYHGVELNYWPSIPKKKATG